MSETNKEIVRRGVNDVWNGHSPGTADEIVASDFVVHASAPEGEIRGRDGIKRHFAALRAAFPDLHFMIDDHIAEGDRVVTRWSAQGTHKGTFQGIPPTGKQVTLTGIDIDRIAGGKIVECWMNLDELGLLQQLGVIPEPGSDA
ncbi:MAG: ester cyclase [Thermomicrobiales bacterium]